MSASKYCIGQQIRTVGEFEKSGHKFFKVKFGNKEKTIHRGFLISWQYRTLENFINRGWLYEAEKHG